MFREDVQVYWWVGLISLCFVVDLVHLLFDMIDFFNLILVLVSILYSFFYENFLPCFFFMFLSVGVLFLEVMCLWYETSYMLYHGSLEFHLISWFVWGFLWIPFGWTVFYALLCNIWPILWVGVWEIFVLSFESIWKKWSDVDFFDFNK